MLTTKQERFAQLIGQATEEYHWACYMVAYDAGGTKIKTAIEEASRLLADRNISARVKEIRAAASEAAGVTLQGHLKDLADIKQMALTGDKTASGNIVRNYGAAVAAEVARGKHSGVAAPDKHQDVTPDVPAEEAITELCTQAGVIHETARAHFMRGLEALNTPYTPEPAGKLHGVPLNDDGAIAWKPAPDMVQ